MNNKFVKRLEEFLDSECDDCDLEYSYEWNEDCEYCEVEIKRLDYSACVNFRYNESMACLTMELCEDSWYLVKEYDWQVKYFWMLVAPDLFPELR